VMGTTLRTRAAADIMPGTGTRDRTPEAMAAGSLAAETTEAEAPMLARSREVEAPILAGCREADSMVAAGAWATATKN
jgi:hypothetical protein